MIIPFLKEKKLQVVCNCVKPCGCGPSIPIDGLDNYDLFRTILKSRTTILNLAKSNTLNGPQTDNIYLDLEYVQSLGDQIEYKFRDFNSVTRYTYRYPY